MTAPSQIHTGFGKVETGHAAKKSGSRNHEQTAYLESQGYRVVRFWNNQVEKEMDGVVRALEVLLGEGK